MYSARKFFLKNYNQQIKLIVGLGNIGDTYKNTRHNAGFYFVDYLVHFFFKKSEIDNELEENSSYKVYKLPDIELVILKPSLMMNLSGKSLYEFLKYKEYALDEILLVHDDLDIPLGRYKLQQGKSPRAHNGVKSIEEVLSGNNFFRLRIGIESRTKSRIPGINFVLMQFTEEEKKELELVFDNICINEFSF